MVGGGAIAKAGRGEEHGLWSLPSGEVRDDAVARAGSRVEELACAGFEAQRQSVDGTGRLTQDVGSDTMGSQAQVGLLQGSGSKSGPTALGLALNWADGLSLPLQSEALKGVLFGPSQPRSSGWAAGSGLASFHKEKSIPSQAHLIDSGLLLKACPSASTGHGKVGNLEVEFVRFREEEIGRR